MDGEQRHPKVADALQAWREAERGAVRATAQREAAETAATAAALAETAAQATTRAANAAMLAASEAVRAATATSDAAHKVALVTKAEQDARRVQERDALAAEEEAKSAHRSARDQVVERMHDTGKQESAGALSGTTDQGS